MSPKKERPSVRVRIKRHKIVIELGEQWYGDLADLVDPDIRAGAGLEGKPNIIHLSLKQVWLLNHLHVGINAIQVCDDPPYRCNCPICQEALK